ncbi:hypothetical protein DPEC_G00077250 [Dallia pectoralis]|uniref:Uncharacterized protein n=1 Tax=Dallia pectoralis TaxID=75939 RepID=A0ACC2H3U3_DALPE|nr:hypothetical protein DPEC_G00077250 [Dallia pectoralis]
MEMQNLLIHWLPVSALLCPLCCPHPGGGACLFLWHWIWSRLQSHGQSHWPECSRPNDSAVRPFPTPAGLKRLRSKLPYRPADKAILLLRLNLNEDGFVSSTFGSETGRMTTPTMADKLGLVVGDDTANIMALLERVAGIIDNVQTCQTRMEERQLELENSVKAIQADVVKLTINHTATSSTVDKLLEKTRKVSCHIKDVRVRVENQNIRVKKVETTQEELLAKNKFRVVIYQGDSEVSAVVDGKEPKEPKKSHQAAAAVEPDHFELPPESDEEYMVVEEATSSTAAKMKKSGLSRIESFKSTFSRENMTKTKENMSNKVDKIGERIISTERREKIRQSGERLKQSGSRFKETMVSHVPAKLKKERTVAEGQEGAEGLTENAAPVPPPKGRKSTSPDLAYTEVTKEAEDGGEEEVPMHNIKQLS